MLEVPEDSGVCAKMRDHWKGVSLEDAPKTWNRTVSAHKIHGVVGGMSGVGTMRKARNIELRWSLNASMH